MLVESSKQPVLRPFSIHVFESQSNDDSNAKDIVD